MRRRREQSMEIQQMKYFEEQQQKVKIRKLTESIDYKKNALSSSVLKYLTSIRLNIETL